MCAGEYASENWIIIGSDNGLTPIQWQAITWSNAELLSIRTLETKLQWNLNQNTDIFCHENAFENIISKIAGWW